MKKKLTAFYIFLSLLGIAAAIGIFILGFAALQKADSTKEHVEQTLAQAEEKKNQLTEQQKSQQQTQKEQQIAKEAEQKAAQEKEKENPALPKRMRTQTNLRFLTEIQPLLRPAPMVTSYASTLDIRESGWI